MSNTRQVTFKPTKNGFLSLKINPLKKDESKESMGEWKHINWRKLERRVYKLQKRIYKASQRGDVKAVRRLQKTLMKSWYAKCLAVRRVTQDNAGKKTAGVDGVKSLSPAARLKLVDNLKIGSKVKPTRRVTMTIDKSGQPFTKISHHPQINSNEGCPLLSRLPLGVWIPKPGSEEKRPLGIPIMYDRALQARGHSGVRTRMGGKI